MISKFFNKMKSAKALCIGAVCLLALVLLTAGIAWHVSGAVTGAGKSVRVNYYYANPKWSTMFNPYYSDSAIAGSTGKKLFDDRYVLWGSNPGGSFTLIGPGYVKTFAEFMTQNGNYANVATGTLLDCETYYLDKPDPTTQGLQWAYTFVGWHIVGADTYIPMETVFQMGDVIPAHVAEQYDTNADDGVIAINFETLWARCFFVQDATDANGAATGAGPYVYDRVNSQTETRYGNDPKNPLSSISEAYRARNTTFTDDVNINGTGRVGVATEIYNVTFNAYSHAIMLTGDTTCNRTNGASGEYRMFSPYYRAHSATIKSLQATRSNSGVITRSDGKRHKLTMGLYGFSSAEFYIIASTRFDNVDYYQDTELIFEVRDAYSYVDSAALPGDEIIKNNHYFETTSRFTTSKKSGLKDLYVRSYTCEKMVLNGGKLAGVYVGWVLPEKYSQDVLHTWYFGRNVDVSGSEFTTMIGFNSPEADGKPYSSNDRVIITGGHFTHFYGAGASMGDATAVTGNRDYLLYGKQNFGGNIKVDHTYEYDPRIDNFYGGGEYYKINGDITIKGYGCSYLKNLYAGGKFYPAVVTGNITSTFEDCDFSGVVSGGGQYADTSGDGKGIIDLTFKEGSTVTGNVYGSGMGYVTTFTKTETDVREKPADWETVAPTGFPAAEIQPDGSVWILTSRYKTIGSVTGSSDLRYIVRALYSFVSTAKANSTNVVVDNSTIQGDLFGGGDYASVVGDTHVTVQNNAIIGTSGTGSVFGGSDATTPMPALKLYKPYEGVYSAPTTTGQAVNYGTAYPNTFTWVDDESLKNAGIDFTNFRVYTDAKKGEVGGSTFVSVTSGAKVGHIFGGGNAGDVLGSTAIAIEDATVTNNVFGGCYAADVGGDVNITVNGSTSIGWYIFGGNDQDGAIGGNITTVMNGGTVKEDIYGSSRSTHFNNISTVKINGGTVENDVFGGGFEGNAGDTIVTVSGGTIKGNLYGGGDKGTANNTVININGGSLTFDAGTDHSGAAYSAYGLFGGGYGVQATVASTQVNIAGGSFNSAIYGGGYSGAVTGLAKVTVTVPGYVFPLDKNKVEDGRVYGLFGGGYRGSVGSTHVIFDNERCSVLAATYGGGYEGAVTGTAKIEVKQRYSQYKALYGGGYGENATVGNVDIDIANITTQENAVIYGGGNLGPVNGNVNIDIQDITTTGHIFGGGNQAQVGGNVVLNITGYASASGGDSKDEIYGGGRNGKVVGNITINLLDCVVTGNICGGGYEGAVDGSTSITIDGTTLGSTEAGTVYGGGFSGSVAGSTYILLQPNAHINGTVYGGGNRGSIGGSTEIHAYSNFINNIFGGCTAASVAKDTNVTLYDGAGINYHLYGGNQTSGDIGGKTTVTVKGGTVDGYVLGGGQNATTDATTYVIIEGGNVCVGAGTNEFGGVYGGGYQAGVGNTNVTIKGGTVGSDAWAGSVYGGSYGGGSRVTSTTVNMINGTVKGNVYGGGYSGAVDTNTAVTVSGGMATNVFGGGYKGDVDGNTALKVTGGELTAAFGGNDTSGRINGNITVDVEGGTIGQLYGGGSKAHIDADITDSITLNIKGGTVTDGFGGGMLAYTALTPKVTVTGGNVGTLYGGGYQATTVGSDVIVNNGTIGTLYGGGYAGAVGNTKLVIDDSGNNTNTITINGNVYGGGEGVTATVNESASVTINMNCSFTATESAFTTDQITPSGAVSTQITNLNYRSSIRGNVYGGGNLGRVGEGIIYVGGESAKVTSAGTTNVLVTNGYIAGSVFAGGRGIPGNGQSYDVSMGAIFGSTKVTINGGYIGKVDALQGEITGNVYGGGEQSRIFSNDKAADVLIEEVSGKSIAIKGSVFGGGDRGEEGATNASVPTVIGDVTVKIAGIENASSSNIYFLEGGVYGDGNLCLVNGNREIDIINFNAAGNLLKTFYSLQRADLVTMDNSAIVLLGAKDLVAENDNNNYSINRIGHLQMTDGSTVKLDQVVNYLGELTSDVHYNQYFIHLGNSGTIGQGGNGYTGHGCTDSCLVERLTTEKINAYRAGQLHNGEKNVVCVANGLYLEVMNEAGAYGPVKGLFTLQLLYANPGEGGGFVYGSIPESTGDFICETHKWDYIVANDVTAQTFDANKHFVRIAGRGYARTTDAFDANQTYYTAVETSEFMDIIDDVGGYRNSSYTHYYWYIGGDEIRYDVSITGYIGVGDTAFTSSVNVPQHAEDMAYVLHSVSANQTLLDALNAHTYTLDTDATNLTGNDIAIELRLGNTSLGFLGYSGGQWFVKTTQDQLYGYNGNINALDDNLLTHCTVADGGDYVTWVLHKATTVPTTIDKMAVYLDIDKYEYDTVNNKVSNVTTDLSTLSFSTYMSIVRLRPTQYLYHDNLRSYTGVGASSKITITGNSCFTVEYQTNYVPAAYSNTSGPTMVWSLSTGDALPAGTKITMVDLSGDTATYYYYICSSATGSVNLTDFMQMGTKTSIASSATKPAFYSAYTDQEMALFNERLLFIFDFEQASQSMSNGTYVYNNISLLHTYDGEDIMHYTRDDSTQSNPKAIEQINIGVGQNGVGTFTAAFDADSYGDNENAILNVNVTEDAQWINTLFREYGLAVEVDLTNATSMPAGMYISYLGQKFYPGADSTVISVPIYEFGSHELQICNPHGGLAASLNDSSNVAEFDVNFYCAPDAQYHNVYNTGKSASDYFTVADGVLTALQIVPANGPGQILSNGQTLSFRINTDSQAQLFAIGTQTVEVKMLYKENGVYNAVDIGAVFNGTSNTVKSGDQQWNVTGGEPGTYRIVFNYANNTEYLNFIIH